MRKLLFLIILITLLIPIIKVNAQTSSSSLIDILNKTEQSLFTSYDDLDLTKEQFEEIKTLATSFFEEKDNLTNVARSCFDWVNKNITYNPGDNNAYSVFKNKQGICYGYANLFKAMMNALNIPCLVVNGDTTFGAHSWNALYLDGKWEFADPTNGIWTNHHYENFFPLSIDVPLWRENNYDYYYHHGIAISLDKCTDEHVVIPTKTKDFDITVLLYTGNSNHLIKEITLSSSITEISGNSDKYINLKKYHVQNNKVFKEAFDYLINEQTNTFVFPYYIETIIIDNIEELNKNTIYNLPNLTTLKINNVKTINEYAIENCPMLTNIYLSSNIKEIKDNAFYNLNNPTYHVEKETYACNYVLNHLYKVNYIDNQKDQPNKPKPQGCMQNTYFIYLINTITIAYFIIKRK